MATRAQEFRAESQRTGAAKKTKARRAKATKPGVPKAARSRDKKHAAKKATYALEPATEGRPARKSTRSSANRAKADSNLNGREQLRKGTPEAKYAKTKARGARVRGSS
jgi:hypothetical protein